MSNTPDDNMFSKTVKDAVNSRKLASPSSPPTKTPSPKQNATPLTNARSVETKSLNVKVSADKFDWVKSTGAKNFWTNRTVMELAIDALKEKLGD